MRRRLWILILLALALGGALTFGWAAAGAFENATRLRVERATQAATHPWLRIAVAGTAVSLEGTAPDAATAEALTQAARAAAWPATLAAALSAPSTTPEEIDAAPEAAARVVMLREADGATLMGRAPDAATAARLAAMLGAALDSPARDALLSAGEAAPSPRWRMIEDAALSAAQALSVGRITMTAESLAVAGLPRSEEGRIAVERLARALQAAGRTVTLDLAAPATPGGAAVLDIALRPSGAAVDACAAPDAAAAHALTVALSGLAAEQATCAAPAGGVADPDWLVAAQAGVAALARSGAGRFRLEDRIATFAPGESAGEGVAAAAQLAAAMPDGFVLRVEGGAASHAAAPAPSGAVWLRAQAAPGLVLLTGAAPDLATRAAVLSYAAATFGAARVHDGMALATSAAPEGWRAAALAGLDGLAALEAGSLEVLDGHVRLTGLSREPLAARDAHAALLPATARGWRVGSRVTVDLPARAAEALLGPEACAAMLGDQVAAAPIAFAPASADIDAASGPLLDALATTLRRCAGGVVEIGGHTDSQGSAGYNLALSQARAEAVRAALIARGAAAATLAARGYGQAEPVADNAEEAGRARNRRIAFTAQTSEQATDLTAPPAGARP